MENNFRPADDGQLLQAVQWALSENAPLEVRGTGTKAQIGHPVQARATVDLSALTGITLYEPEELVLSAKAGTSRAEIEAALAAQNQEMAFEPPDLSALLGSQHAGTIGGTLAANLSGPRRLKQGAARDHFLGFRAVSGRGENFQSGARVVKNVTGYDLPKIMAGSHGTLGIMSDVTIKVLPAAETEATLAVAGLTLAAAGEVMSAAMKSSCEVSGAAHLPAGIVELSMVETVKTAGTALTILRLEGIGPSVDFRAEKLAGIVKNFGEVTRLSQEVSRSLWREVRDVRFFAADQSRLIWKLSVPPMAGAGVLAGLAHDVGLVGYMDWAGGLLWLSAPPSDHAHAQMIRGSIASLSGHATLIRAPVAVRAAIPVFQPQAPVISRVSARLREAFDPNGILNPGRMSFQE